MKIKCYAIDSSILDQDYNSLIMNRLIKILTISFLLFFQNTAFNQYEYTDGFRNYPDSEETIKVMLSLFQADDELDKKSLQYLDQTWVDGYIPMLLDVIYMSNSCLLYTSDLPTKRIV